MSIFLKDPLAQTDHVVDWSAGYLGGRTIAQSGWAVMPPGPDGITAANPRIDGGLTVVTLSGGRAGQIYRIVNQILLSDGSRDERSLVVRVEER